MTKAQKDQKYTNITKHPLQFTINDTLTETNQP